MMGEDPDYSHCCFLTYLGLLLYDEPHTLKAAVMQDHGRTTGNLGIEQKTLWLLDDLLCLWTTAA